MNWINSAAFTAVSAPGYGDTPRNIARGPSLWQTDLGLVKRIPIRLGLGQVRQPDRGKEVVIAGIDAIRAEILTQNYDVNRR